MFQSTSAVGLSAQYAPTGTLMIKVTGAKKGQLGVRLFKDAAGFPEDDTRMIARRNIEIDQQTMTGQLVFRGIPYGTYALSVRHDENPNGKLNKNFVGIPKEGYGVSNNPKPKMRAPGFDEAKFTLDSPEHLVEIRLVYR